MVARCDFFDVAADLLHDTDATALLVTHDVDEAAAIADRTVLLGEIQGTR